MQNWMDGDFVLGVKGGFFENAKFPANLRWGFKVNASEKLFQKYGRDFSRILQILMIVLGKLTHNERNNENIWEEPKCIFGAWAHFVHFAFRE